MRYGAVFALGLAFVGSASNEIIEKLLDRAVKDVNDDVRRASMIAIGLVLINQPSETVKLVQLVKDSYNPNVRYGASMALAIACANSGNKEALEILDQAARKDSVDFVRQGSLVAAAFVATNHSESSSPKSKVVREYCEEIIKDKHEDSIVKFGASIALGVLNCGGRNLVVGNTAGGVSEMRDTAVGFFLFAQSWFWFPLSFFVQLCFKPALVCCVNSELKVPNFESKIETPKGVDFEYPERTKELTVSAKEKVDYYCDLG